MAAERASRELTAILLADIVGYSRLVAADEPGTLARVEALHAELAEPLIAEHRGRLVKAMGDGFLVAFHSVGDAVDCVNIAARLQQIAEPGAVFVSQTVADHLRGAPGIRLEDLGARSLKNMPAPVRVWRASRALASAAPPPWPARAGLRLAVMAGAAVVIGAAATALWLDPRGIRPAPIRSEALALPDKPSIAVLPFANMSDDPQQGYFADGMTEDLITELGKISGLFVISRSSVFPYRDRAVEIREVGEELGVRYVLEGSVRRFGDQVRITGQLIDATTGGHLWAENYDGSVGNIFAFQDEVRSKIVDSLAVVLTPDEQRSLALAGTDSVEAYEAYLKGLGLLNQAQQFFIDPLVDAEGWFKKAIELDPRYARAMAALAWRDYLMLVYTNDPYRSKMTQAFALAERSLALQETATAYVVLSKRHFRPRAYGGMIDMGSDHEGAIALLEKARALEPGSADVLAELAYVLVFAGELGRAAALIGEAKRLNPSYPVWYRRPSGIIHYFNGDFAAAAEDFRAWRDAEPQAWGDGSIWLAAAQAMAGDTMASRETIAPFRRSRPYTTTVDLSRWLRFADPQMWKVVEKGLVAAGMPGSPT